MMKNKVHPLSNIEYDAHKKTLSLEGVIIEKGRDISVDDRKRTYLGVEPSENGVYDLHGRLCLRERSDVEKRETIELIRSALEPPMKRIIRESTIWNLPYNLLVYIGRQTINNARYLVLEAKKDVRKRKLQRKIPGMTEEDLERKATEYENVALGYVRNVIKQTFDTNGENSELFMEVSARLLSEKERGVIQENIRQRKELLWRVGCVEDRRYAIDDINILYEQAREFAERFKFSKDSYLQYLQDIVERSPLHVYRQL